MRSDERVKAALAALQPGITQYRYVVSSTLERAQSILAAEFESIPVGVSLGEFAVGKIDTSRFALVSGGSAPIDAGSRVALERAILSLEQLLLEGDDLFCVAVPTDASPGEAVRQRLSRIGLAFAQAGIIELVRRRNYNAALHGSPLDEQPFETWTPSERRLAPPLIVRVRGSSLDPFELAPFLDGCMHLVLAVDGETSPGLLARLISPGVFVAQTDELSVLGSLKDLDAPAVVALLNGSEARFVHDPRGGWAAWQRLRIVRSHDSRIRKSLGNRTAWQQREDIAHLNSLADLAALTTSVGATPSAGSRVVDPTERLTAWLLEQSTVAATV